MRSTAEQDGLLPLTAGYISGGTTECLLCLPVVRALGIERLYLNVDPRFRLRDVEPSPFDESAARALMPLLQRQPYLKDVRLYSGQPVDYNLDLFRYLDDLTYRNLTRSMLETFGCDLRWMDEPWLFVPPRPTARGILLARNDGYPSPEASWGALLGEQTDDMAFVGSAADHRGFLEHPATAELARRIPFYECANLLEAACLIAGCRRFMGSQGPEHAIAEGLKKELVQVVCEQRPHAVFLRPGARYLPDKYELGWTI